jgi:hypothetical protein
MWINCFIRHYWSGVRTSEMYLIEKTGKLKALPNVIATMNGSIRTDNLLQNFNSFALKLKYTWHVANGSFLTAAWIDEADDFERGVYDAAYGKNLNRTFNAAQTNSFSIRFVYFLDYATVRSKWKKR